MLEPDKPPNAGEPLDLDNAPTLPRSPNWDAPSTPYDIEDGPTLPPKDHVPREGASNASSGAAVAALSAGQKVFNRYTLRRILGRGGMGVVWLAWDEELEEEVALKFLPDVVAYNPGAVKGLKRETKRARELTHPNVLRIHDIEHDGTQAAIAMEYVVGETLAGLREEQPGGVFTVEQLGPWLRQLCEALEYAHGEAKVVHRDLKPANLMVNRKGQLKVMDFGVARSISDSMSRLTQGSVGTSGTLAYMSPQQLDNEAPGPADDTYSLGATLYDLLTGKPPFYGGDIARLVREKMPPGLAERRRELAVEGGGEIPAAWERTIAACLAKRAEDRPRSAREVAERLGLLLGREGGLPRPPISFGEPQRRGEPARPPTSVDEPPREGGVPPPPILPAGRRIRQWAVGAVVVALAGAAALAFWGMRQRGGRPAIPIAKRQEQPAKGGTTNQRPAEAGPRPGERWTNSLGMVFAPVPGTEVLFCVWETRVQDFEAFVKAKGYDATAGMYSLRSDGWKQRGDTWRSPGFPQGLTHPVCGVSWDDARAFCAWLTEKERTEGSLGANQSYRLPTDAEWSLAVGLPPESGSTPKEKDAKIKDVYPWGTQWPPPSGAGNYAGEEARDTDWPSGFSIISSYRDGYARTAPVGTFAANKYGLYDLGGNVWEWCEDWYGNEAKYRVLRGGSWLNDRPEVLLSSYRVLTPVYRRGSDGVRVVLAGGVSAR